MHSGTNGVNRRGCQRTRSAIVIGILFVTFRSFAQFPVAPKEKMVGIH